MAVQSPYKSIVFMGQACSGKGTQARLLSKELGYPIFSTGDKTREIAAEDTPLGRHIAGVHTTGWIPEWLASYLMTRALLEEFPEEGLIFESVARKPEEARKLHEIHTEIGRPYVVLYLQANEPVLVERMQKRDREGYDTEEKIQKRLQAFRDETMHSIEFFKARGVLCPIDASRTPEEVFTDVVRAVTS